MQEQPGSEGGGQQPASEAGQPSPPSEPRDAQDIVDEVGADSFPASDPPQWWAGPPD